MNFKEFKSLVRDYPVIDSKVFDLLSMRPEILRNQITDWIKKGYLIKLKKGLYVFDEAERQKKVSKFFLANQIYTPSYVSLESALSFYGFIPEAVYSITSISTKKTSSFRNSLGVFSYQSLKTSAFDYFEIKKDEFGNQFKIASPEKALLDFLYLKTREFRNLDSEIFEESFRFQNLEDIDINKLLHIANIFQQKKLLDSANKLAKYIREEWQ